MTNGLVVVIVNYRTPRATAALANALLEDEAVDEVVVADNSPPDADVLRDIVDPRVAIVANGSNLGFGAASNRAVRASSAEIILFLNSDAVPAGGAIPRLLAAFRDPEVAIAAPKLVLPTGQPQIDATGQFPTFDVLLRRSNRRAAERIDWVSGAALAVRRSAFESVGGFDERYHMYLEDVVLCERIGSERIRLVEDAFVVHAGGGSSESTFRRQVRYARSQRLYLRDARTAMPLRAAAWAASWLAFAVRRTVPSLRWLRRGSTSPGATRRSGSVWS